MDILCNDIINEILLHLDGKSVASFLSTNKEMAKMADGNVMMKDRRLLAQELKKAVHKEKKHYKSFILNLVVGDRINDKIHNYKVRYVCKKFAILNIVDMYGNIIDDEYVYTKIHNFRNVDNNLAWATWHKDDGTIIIIKLSYGLLKHTCGPEITNVDSRYLTYKTREQHILIPHYVGEPSVDMLVTVAHGWVIYEYVILSIDDNTMKLRHLDDVEKVEKELKALKHNNKWIIDKHKYMIMSFGGFK